MRQPTPLRLASLFTALFAAFCFLPRVNTTPRLVWSFWGAAGALVLLLLFVRGLVRSKKRLLSYQVAPRPVHYVQLMMHSSIYAYWGWYWREVYHHIPLIAAQIVFAYALDMLVCWSRRDKWVLGFGPFPIVLSTNLFLWFKDDWFFLQFLMIATGVLCKEFMTWIRNGRRCHIFNPSAIALFVFSIGLIVTQSTQISWGEEIAVSFQRPPHIYLEIFLLGLVVQALFSVTLVTLSAAASLYLLNIWYTGATGIYFFVDSNIPSAVFLGLHLLVTDPATSPRRDLGKIVFGAMYGASVFGLYWLLGAMGVPTFYDKLLCVPPLNLTVRWLDRLRWAPAWSPRQANFAYMAVWICLFAVMFGTGFVDRRHPGADPEFWRRACEEKRGNACETWTRMMNVACQHGSGRSCVALGFAFTEGRMVPRDFPAAAKNFGRACDAGSKPGCTALVTLVQSEGEKVLKPACAARDGESCFLLASLYHAGRGVAKDYGRAVALFRQSCESGWLGGCSGLGECYRAGQGTAADPEKAIAYFEKACRGGVVPSCFSVAEIYRGRSDELLARRWLRQGCGFSVGYAQSNAAYFQAEPTAVPRVCAGFQPPFR